MVRQNAGYVKHKIDHIETTEERLSCRSGLLLICRYIQAILLPFVRSTEGRYRCI